MPIRFNTCPFCHEKIVFTIEMEDIDSSQYPAPAYILHKSESCGKTSTFYFDSLLNPKIAVNILVSLFPSSSM